jgi:hypothetical protein
MWLSGLSQIATTRGFSDLTSHASNSSKDKRKCINKGQNFETQGGSQRDVVYLA